jgi:hypothetical protein
VGKYIAALDLPTTAGDQHLNTLRRLNEEKVCTKMTLPDIASLNLLVTKEFDQRSSSGPGMEAMDDVVIEASTSKCSGSAYRGWHC